LADIANPSANVVNFSYAELTGSNGLNESHFVQRAPARIVVGSLKDSSTLNVLTWLDSDNTIPSPLRSGSAQSTREQTTPRLGPTAPIGWLCPFPATNSRANLLSK
jgi:hypothetical protein